MSEQLSTWDEIRQLVDQIELEVHLAGMEARDRWRALQPQVAVLEKKLACAGSAVERELGSIGAALRRLRDDVVRATKPS